MSTTCQRLLKMPLVVSYAHTQAVMCEDRKQDREAIEQMRQCTLEIVVLSQKRRKEKEGGSKGQTEKRENGRTDVEKNTAVGQVETIEIQAA